MRLVASVDAPVGVERRGRAEALGADVANVRLFAGVRPQVPRQQRRPVELLAAVLAREHGSLADSLRRLLRGLLGTRAQVDGRVHWACFVGAGLLVAGSIIYIGGALVGQRASS